MECAYCNNHTMEFECDKCEACEYCGCRCHEDFETGENEYFEMREDKY